MKIILIVLGGLVLLVVVVVGIGYLLPTRHVASRSASYHAAPEKLFALITGPQNWRPDVVKCESVSGDVPGTFQRETTRNGETVTYEILDSVPPASVKRRIATKNLPYSGTWTYSLQSAAGVTTVRITENGEVYNPVFRFMSRLVFGQTAAIDAYLRALGKATGEDVQVTD
ncbi:MAG TPA: SRPBCC family protein [Candidatus Acidoferrales bacterium]|nr:SRPBCC family protein [Candidatus Acidoferrales bacterium]